MSAANMEVNYARQIIKAASMSPNPKLNSILEEFDKFTKSLSAAERGEVKTEEIMKILVKVGRKAKNNEFLRYFDSIYGPNAAMVNDTLLHTNGSVSTKSGFTAQRSHKKRHHNSSLRANQQGKNLSFKQMQLNISQAMARSGNWDKNVSSFEPSMHGNKTSGSFNQRKQVSINPSQLQKLYGENQKDKRSFLTANSFKRSSSKSRSHSKSSRSKSKSRSHTKSRKGSKELQRVIRKKYKSNRERSRDIHPSAQPKKFINFSFKNDFKKSIKESRRNKKTSFKLSSKNNSTRAKTTSYQKRKSRSVSPNQKFSQEKTLHFKFGNNNNALYLHTEPYIVETQQSANYSPKTQKSQKTAVSRVSRNLSRNFENIKRCKSSEPKLSYRSYMEMFNHRKVYNDRSRSREKTSQCKNKKLKPEAQDETPEPQTSIPIRTKLKPTQNESEKSAELMLVTETDENLIDNMLVPAKSLKFDKEMRDEQVEVHLNGESQRLLKSFAERRNSNLKKKFFNQMKEEIKLVERADELRTIILKGKAFVGWKKKTTIYRNVKEFIIHRLCLQKMRSKVTVFSVLKHHWKIKKQESKNWKMALGQRAIFLLKGSLQTWHKNASRLRTMKRNFVKISLKNQKSVKSNAFKLLRRRFNEEYAINQSLEERVQLLKRNKREKIFRDIIETVDDSLFEKSLEKRSQFFFGYWGAREFFKKAFLYTSIKKQERSNIQKADHFRFKRLISKGFYTLVDNFNDNQTMESQATFHYFKNLISKGFFSLSQNWEVNKLPEKNLTEREVVLGYKFLTALSQGVSYRNYDVTTVRDYLDKHVGGRMSSDGENNADLRNDPMYANEPVELRPSEDIESKNPLNFGSENENNQNSIIEHSLSTEQEGNEDQNRMSANLYSSKPEQSQRFSASQNKLISSEKEEGMIEESLVEDIEYSEQTSERLRINPNTHLRQAIKSTYSSQISSMNITQEEEFRSRDEHEINHFARESVNLIAEMPILVEKINPPKFIQTTYQYNLSLLRNYFEALKYITFRRKNFVERKELERKKVIFNAFRRFTHEQQLMRFIQNKMRLKRAKKYLRKSFEYLTNYSTKMKKLREAEEVYTQIKDQEIVETYFYRFIERAKHSQIEKSNYKKAIQFRADRLLSKGFENLKMYKSRRQELRVKFDIIRVIDEERIQRQTIENWLKVAYFKRRIGYTSRNLQRLLDRNLASSGFEMISNRALLVTKNDNIIEIMQNRRESAQIKKGFSILKYFAVHNRADRELNEFSTYHRSIVQLTKAMVGLNVYMRYRQHKKAVNEENTLKLRKNNQKFMLKKWRQKTLSHAKIYYFRDLVNKLMKKELFKQNQAVIQNHIYQKEKFIDEIDLRKKQQFFCEWRRYVAHKAMLRRTKEVYISHRKNELKHRFMKIWYSKLSHIKSQEYQLTKAEKYRNSKMLNGIFKIWKRHTFVQKLPIHFQEEKNSEVKQNCLLALRNYVEKKKSLRTKQHQLSTKIKNKLLQKYFRAYQNQFSKAQILSQKYQEYKLNLKRKWLSNWVEETNIKLNQVEQKIELAYHHPSVAKVADKLIRFRRNKFKGIFKAFREQVVHRKENRNTHVKVYKLIRKSHNFRSKLKIVKLWQSASADRTLKYEKTRKVGDILTGFYDKVNSEAKKESIDNLKNLFEHLKNEDRLNFRADNLKRRTLKGKMFTMLCTNRRLNQSLKSGIQKLKEVLKDKKSKAEALGALELIHRRELSLKSILRNKILNSERLDKSSVLLIFNQNLNRWRVIEGKINDFTARREIKIIRKVLKQLQLRVTRRHIFQKRANKIKFRNEFNTMTSIFSQWKEAVIENPSSLFNKTNMLKGALQKLHILRILDDLQNFKETAKQRKELISEKVFNLEYILTMNNKMIYFQNLLTHCEEKIEIQGKISQLCLTLQNHLETQIQYEGFHELKKHQQREEYGKVLARQKRYKTLQQSLYRMSLFVQKFCRNKRIVERNRDANLKSKLFEILKEKTFQDQNSLFNRETKLREKLSLMRIAYSVKKLRLNKEKNSFKARRIRRAVLRLENGIDKVRFESKNLALKKIVTGFKTSKFTAIIQEMLNIISIRNAVSRLNENAVFQQKSEYVIYKISQIRRARLLSSSFNALGNHTKECQYLELRADNFRQYALLEKQGSMFRNWVDHVFSDPDSFYNKNEQAVAHYEKKLKFKFLSSLIQNLRQVMIEERVQEMISNRETRLLQGMMKVFKKKVSEAQEKMDRALQLKVFLQWKEFVRNNKLLNSYLMEEKELLNESTETIEQNNQKERFLNLLMPEFNQFSDSSKTKSKQFHDYSDQGIEDEEENSNSFADFKSAI